MSKMAAMMTSKIEVLGDDEGEIQMSEVDQLHEDVGDDYVILDDENSITDDKYEDEIYDEDIINHLLEVEAQFHRSCKQIQILDQHIDELHAKYKLADDNEDHSFRQTTRVKLSALEDIHHMYVKYATSKAEELLQLQNELLLNVRKTAF